MSPSTNAFNDIQVALQALSDTVIVSKSLRRAVQSSRGWITPARAAGHTWATIAYVFVCCGYPNANKETVRNYYFQDDAKIIAKQSLITSAVPAPTVVYKPNEATTSSTLISRSVEELGKDGPIIPDYIE